jgi:CIC family chloride channel protein
MNIIAAQKKIIQAFHLFYVWRKQNLSDKSFLIFSSIVIGTISGLAAVFLKNAVHFIQQFLKTGLNEAIQNYGYLFYPTIGLLLTVIYVQVFRNGKFKKGVGQILVSIMRWGGRVDANKTYSHIFSSALTVGFGGSSGLEAPIVVTGSAIGSNVSSLFKLSANERVLMLACGAGAGISAVFNAPIAGVLFAMEVLLFQFSIPYFIPLLISSACAAVISKALYSGQLFVMVSSGYNFNEIPFYVLLGIVCGLISVYITKVTLFVEGKFDQWKSIYIKAVSGGLILGVMIFFLPPLYGEGYDIIQNLMNERYMSILNNSVLYDWRKDPFIILIFAAFILFFKIIATSITLGAGGNGGIFAPSLFIGAFTGFVFADIFRVTGTQELTMVNFIVVGMAGVLSGVNHSPLTAIFLIAEITGGYKLFVPLMLVSALSFFISRYILKYTVYTKKLDEVGLLPDLNKDKNVLMNLDIKQVLETDFVPVYPHHQLNDIISAVEISKRNLFPVISEKGLLVGVLHFDDIRNKIFKPEIYGNTLITELMQRDFKFINADHSDMSEVMELFEQYQLFNLPVVDENGLYLGFLSRSTIFVKYRSTLIKQSQTIDHL